MHFKTKIKIKKKINQKKNRKKKLLLIYFLWIFILLFFIVSLLNKNKKQINSKMFWVKDLGVRKYLSSRSSSRTPRHTQFEIIMS